MKVPEYGELIRTEAEAILEYRRRFHHAPEKVWEALTDPDRLAAWFPTTIDGERAAGAALTFRFEQIGIEPIHGEMLRFEPPSLLEFTWGGDRLCFALEPDGDGTTLTFTVTLGELGKATRDAGGWHQSLEGLVHALAGGRRRDYDAHHWRDLRDAYAERFGPEASVLGPPREWEAQYGECPRR
jgi:uncharacterized protein YndB with AHSA1/START domain